MESLARISQTQVQPPQNEIRGNLRKNNHDLFVKLNVYIRMLKYYSVILKVQ